MLSPPHRGDRGSVLALVPAGFLVLIVLGAIAVDSAVALLGQRQLADVAAAAANDAAGAALTSGAFYGSGRIAIDPAVAATTACRDLAAAAVGDVRDVRLAVAVGGASVAVRASGRVVPVFGRRLPGAAQRVSASAVAVATRGAELPVTVPTDFSEVTC